MITSKTSNWTTAAAIVLFGFASAAQPAFSQIGPKNLASPTYRGPAVPTVVHKGLTDREAKRLAAIAETRTDHLKLAEFYTAKADRLEAQAAGYEEAAASYRNSPMVKNLISPTTSGRYEFFAKEMRAEAKSNRALAASQERMAVIAWRLNGKDGEQERAQDLDPQRQNTCGPRAHRGTLRCPGTEI